MRRLAILFVVCALLAALVSVVAQGKTQRLKEESPLNGSEQLILVTTRDWDTVEGKLLRFERKNARAEWEQVGHEIPIVVGRSGLGWGAGINVQTGGGPVKKEGDGKSPAGVFRLDRVFGFAPASEASWLLMPYMQLTPTVECVDDAKSRWYNLVFDTDGVDDADWKSSERMRSVEGYRWGVIVEHNALLREPGHGSCIFLHIWSGPDKGTAGCTAMEQPNLEAIVHWLDAKKKPLLVQLPEAEYARLRDTWKLPAPMR